MGYPRHAARILLTVATMRLVRLTKPRATRPGLPSFSGGCVDETALARENRKLRQELAELRRTIDAVAYMRTETPAFDPATHPWCVQARATREALLALCACHAA